MNEYSYILLACGGLENGDWSMEFDNVSEAFDYAEKLEDDGKVVSWMIKRIKAGTWTGKSKHDCIR